MARHHSELWSDAPHGKRTSAHDALRQPITSMRPCTLSITRGPQSFSGHEE